MGVSITRAIDEGGYSSIDEVADIYIKLDKAGVHEEEDIVKALGVSLPAWTIIKTNDEFIQKVYRLILIDEAGNPEKMRQRISALQEVASNPEHRNMVNAQKLLEQQLGTMAAVDGHRGSGGFNLTVALVNVPPIDVEHGEVITVNSGSGPEGGELGSGDEG